jgi:hypothetical protein
MDKKNKKLSVDKATIKPLTNEDLDGMAGGTGGYSLIWEDTCLVTCTQYNCGYTYRNCTE